MLTRIAIIFITIAFTASLSAQTTQPAPLGSVRGHVAISGNFGLVKPDLSRVVVYVNSDPKLDESGKVPPSAVVAQQNKKFVPSFVVIPIGTNVEFPNWDHFDHNVFSRSAAAPAFDLERYPYGQAKTRTFTKLGVVQVFCNIHPQMRAIIYVVPNKYFARCDREGNFEIKDVPAGNYEVVAWNDRCDSQRQKVDISTDGSADISFALSENRDRSIAADANRNAGYDGVGRGLGVKMEQLNLPVVKDAHPATCCPPGETKTASISSETK